MPQFLAVFIRVVLTIGIFTMMRRAWLCRERSVIIHELPALPVGSDYLDGGIGGVYVSTTLAGQPYERVVTRGLGVRSPVRVHVRPDGIVLARTGASDLFIPEPHPTSATTTGGMIGKIAAAHSIIVFRWTAGGTPVDTGAHLRSGEQRQLLLTQTQTLIDNR